MNACHFPAQIVQRLFAKSPGDALPVQEFDPGIRIRRNGSFAMCSLFAVRKVDPVFSVPLLRVEPEPRRRLEIRF